MTVIVTTSPLAMVQVAVAGTEPADGLPPEIVTVGATVYPEPPSVILILYNTPSLYSVDWILPVEGEPVNTLPIVNGLKKLHYGIHYYDNKPLLNNTLCNHTLKSGKNKGNKCNKNCKLGYNVCGTHLKFISTSTN